LIFNYNNNAYSFNNFLNFNDYNSNLLQITDLNNDFIDFFNVQNFNNISVFSCDYLTENVNSYSALSQALSFENIFINFLFLLSQLDVNTDLIILFIYNCNLLFLLNFGDNLLLLFFNNFTINLFNNFFIDSIVNFWFSAYDFLFIYFVFIFYFFNQDVLVSYLIFYTDSSYINVILNSTWTLLSLLTFYIFLLYNFLCEIFFLAFDIYFFYYSVLFVLYSFLDKIYFLLFNTIEVLFNFINIDINFINLFISIVNVFLISFNVFLISFFSSMQYFYYNFKYLFIHYSLFFDFVYIYLLNNNFGFFFSKSFNNNVLFSELNLVFFSNFKFPKLNIFYDFLNYNFLKLNFNFKKFNFLINDGSIVIFKTKTQVIDDVNSKLTTNDVSTNFGNMGVNEFFFRFDSIFLNFNKNSFLSLRNFRLILDQYVKNLINMDYFLDWRELRLERDVWRSSDDLSIARRHWQLRKKYYANFYEPESLISKVSIWLPNHLIPGWAFITPYSSRLRYTALGKVDIALVVVLAASVGSVFSSVNYVITYKYIGSPIFKSRKELRSFFVDGLLVGSRMMILANPALIIGIILLLSDRHFGTSVFDFSGGGDTILFQHLFWFFGHPEVYIIIIPCFGFMNSLLPYYLKKRLSGRLSLQFSMYTIAFMGFAVWGHHMYMVGLANSVRTLYSTMTVMISVPASTKVLHWCVTIINSTITCDVGFLFLLSFMYFFVLGGLSGMFLAHIGFDVIFHDTFFVIGHFHVMLAGAAMSCVFAAFYFYFPAIFGVKYSRFFAYLHFTFYLSGQLLTLIPMFWLGYAGMPRRIMDYPTVFSGWHSIISSGHILTFLGFLFFLFMIFDSIYENKAPISKTKGVSRLNNRFSLYIYESRKLKFSKNKNLLNQNSYIFYNKLNYNNLSKLELQNFEYVFLK